MFWNRHQLPLNIYKTAPLAISLVALISLTGCAQKLWVKPGASQNDFASDKYACMQESQQQQSSAAVNAYGGAAQSGTVTNVYLFNSCMNAKGWSLQNTQAVQQNVNNQPNVQERMNQFNQEYQDICSTPEYAPLFTKTPCMAKEISFEQLTDTTKITSEQKPLLSKYRTSVDHFQTERETFMRANGETLNRIADYVDSRQPEIDKYNLDLYNGIITWGEYNQRRKDLTTSENVEIQKIIQNKH